MLHNTVSLRVTLALFFTQFQDPGANLLMHHLMVKKRVEQWCGFHDIPVAPRDLDYETGVWNLSAFRDGAVIKTEDLNVANMTLALTFATYVKLYGSPAEADLDAMYEHLVMLEESGDKFIIGGVVLPKAITVFRLFDEIQEREHDGKFNQ